MFLIKATAAGRYCWESVRPSCRVLCGGIRSYPNRTRTARSNDPSIPLNFAAFSRGSRPPCLRVPSSAAQLRHRLHGNHIVQVQRHIAAAIVGYVPQSMKFQ